MKAIEIENLEEKLREMIEVQNLTHRVAGEQFGVENQTISKWCRRFGIKAQRTGPRSGSGHPDWKGGVRILKGYRYIYSPDHPNRTGKKVVAEHRLVMEKKIGRYLERREVVHHIDGNPLNNHPDNLVLFSHNGEHLRHELTGKCPKWSEEGKAKILSTVRGYRCSSETSEKLSAAAKKSQLNRKRNSSGCYQPKSDDGQPPQ